MSSSYSDADLHLLKQTMLQREANSYHFMPEDVDMLVARTQLSRTQVEKWDGNTHYGNPGDKLVAFLTRETEDKVFYALTKHH